MDEFLKRIKNREITVAVMGLGYVGLPLFLELIDNRIKTIGVEVDPKKIDDLHNCISYVDDISNEQLKASFSGVYHSFSSSLENISVDVVVITVPTPIDVDHEPDLACIESCVNQIEKNVIPQRKEDKPLLVLLESTVHPGCSERVYEYLRVAMEDLGVTSPLLVAFSPERVDPGSKVNYFEDVYKVVGGVTNNAAKAAYDFYSLVYDHVYLVSSAMAAELTKLYENCFRSVNIALVNELSMFAHEMDINFHEVIRAASTKPFGFMPFKPGPGVGGHCIPVDPYYLIYKAKEQGISLPLIQKSLEVNDEKTEFVQQIILDLMDNDLKGRVLILGKAYKKNIKDYRESPTLKIISYLEEMGIAYDVHDPHVYPEQCWSYPIENADKYHLMVLMTDHDGYNYNSLVTVAPLLLDPRGRLSEYGDRPTEYIDSKIISL